MGIFRTTKEERKMLNFLKKIDPVRAFIISIGLVCYLVSGLVINAQFSFVAFGVGTVFFLILSILEWRSYKNGMVFCCLGVVLLLGWVGMVTLILLGSLHPLWTVSLFLMVLAYCDITFMWHELNKWIVSGGFAKFAERR